MQKDLLQLLDENKLPELFLELGDLAPANPTGKRLRQEYVSGTHRTDVDYLGRLRTYVQSLDLATLYQQRQSHTLLRCTAAVPEYFLGREKELAAIKTGLQAGNLKLMNGEGGIGKTTLAAKYWQDSRQDYSYRAWLFCESGILNNLLLRLAPALDLDLKGVPTEQQLELLAATIERLPGRFLLVLDNANDAEELRRFERFSRDLPWEVLVTTRCTRGFERMYQIESLPPEQARELFLTHCPPKGDGFDGLLDRFLQAVNYHTLCVEIFAKNLREGRRAGYHLAELLKDLESEGLFLADRSFEIRTKYDGNVQREAATSDDLLRILYDFTTLTEAEIFLLIQLALLPAESHSLTVTGPLLRYPRQETVAGPRRLFGLLSGKMTTRTSYGQELPVLKRQLDALVADGWLFAEEEGYRMSPVVQKIVRQAHAERLWEMGEWMVERLREWFRTNGGYLLRPVHELEIYEPLGAEMLEALGIVPYACVVLQFHLGDYYFAIGQYDTTEITFQKVIDYSQKHEEPSIEAVCWERLGNLALAIGDNPNARVHYEQSLDIRQRLAQQNPKSEQLQRDLSVSYHKIADLLQAEGKNQDARQQFQLALDIAKRLAQQNPKSEQLQRDLSVSYEKIGNLLQAEGKNQDARQQFQLALDIRQRLAQQNPKSEQLQRDLSVSYEKIGNLLQAEGKNQDARQQFQLALDIAKRLAQQNPKSEQLQRDLSVSYEKIGNLLQAEGKNQDARQQFQLALDIAKRLAQQNPKSEQLQRDLSVSYNKIADLLQAEGKNQDARQQFQLALDIRQRLAQQNPKSEQLQRDLSVSYEKIGNLLQAEGKNQDARQQFQLALDIAKRLAQQNPKSEQLQRDLSVSYEKIGNLLQAEGKNQDARQQFQLALDIRQRLAQQNPKSEQLQRDLSYSHYQIGQLLLREEQAEAALAYLEASLAIDKKLVAHNPKAVVLRQDVAASYKALFNYYTTHGTPEALATIQAEALAFYQELVVRYPEVGELREDLAELEAYLRGEEE